MFGNKMSSFHPLTPVSSPLRMGVRRNWIKSMSWYIWSYQSASEKYTKGKGIQIIRSINDVFPAALKEHTEMFRKALHTEQSDVGETYDDLANYHSENIKEQYPHVMKVCQNF